MFELFVKFKRLFACKILEDLSPEKSNATLLISPVLSAKTTEEYSVIILSQN